MRLRTAICLLFCTSLQSLAQYSNPSYGELYESETVSSMRRQIEFFSSRALEGRAAGSEGEREAAGYFAEELERSGVEMMCGRDGDVFGIRLSEKDTLTSRNVAGIVEGYDKLLRERYIVIGARLDNLGERNVNVNGEQVLQTFPGANSNASGLSMLLHLARLVSTNRVLFRRSIVFVAFGASACSNAGSWYFLNRSFNHVDAIDAMINLDVLGTGSNGFYAFTSSNPDLNNILDLMRSSIQPVQPLTVAKEPVQSDHRSFYAKRIPSVFFTTGMFPEYNTVKDLPSVIEYDWMERELEYIYNFTLQLSNGRRPDFGTSAESNSAGAGVQTIRSYHECDVKPMFLNSPDPGVFLRRWVYVYLKYPTEAVENGIQGRVLVDFVIDRKGHVKDVRVLKGVDPLLDDEAVKVVSVSPDWKPGKVNGKPVDCRMSVYVEFRLKKKR